MSISREAAARLVSELKSCTDLADRLLLSMAPTAGPRQFAELRGLVGQFMGDAYLNLVRPLQHQFPGLPFGDASGEDAQDKATQPRAFLTETARVLERHRSLIQACEKSGIFRTDALQEVEAALQGVNEFLARS
jgi:hypothetical protein